MDNYKQVLNDIKQAMTQHPELMAPIYYWLALRKGSFINPFLKDIDHNPEE